VPDVDLTKETAAASDAEKSAPATDSGDLLTVSNLRVHFGHGPEAVQAVTDVSFTVAQGEIVGVVGETGSGKSVTARAVLGLLPTTGRISGGSIEFGGAELTTMKSRDRRALHGPGMALIPQTPWSALNPILTIGKQFENVIRAHVKTSKRECHAKAVAILTEVGIRNPEWVLKGYVHQLSGGMAQRVVIALAVVLGPRLLIADEPTTGLDVTVQRRVLDLITATVREHDQAMLLVTHDLGVVAQYCQRVHVMYQGRIVESNTATELFRNPQHSYTRHLLAAIPTRGADLPTAYVAPAAVSA
jgi:ABC-type dipeptide/oligopeptide/nickel transport system ATPase component